jgi:streptogramin lyase
VRIGIHTGEADLAVDRYVGLSVHRAARICAVGHGGQVLLSQTTASHLEDEEEDLPGIALKDLGEHRLKDISRPVRLYQLDIDGLRTAFPPLTISDRPKPDRRKRVGLAAAALLLAAVTATALALASRDEAPPEVVQPPEVVPNSLVRIDPRTLKPTDVVPIGDEPDIVVAAGGFVWVTHQILADSGPEGRRNAGDRVLTRVDPATGDVVVVGGGLAPCGLTPDPSGDVWVANCFAEGSANANVVRVDASTLEFEATWPVPTGGGQYWGLAYGGGSLWVSGENRIIKVDPRTGAQRSIRSTGGPPLAWSEGYGDLWISNFGDGTVSRMRAASRRVETTESGATNPGYLLVDRDVVWVADWSGPRFVRLSAVGSSKPRTLILPAVYPGSPGVWSVAAGAGAVWATTPRDGALWRIDPETNGVTRIPIAHLPTWVTVGDDDLWLTVRGG